MTIIIISLFDPQLASHILMRVEFPYPLYSIYRYA